MPNASIQTGEDREGRGTTPEEAGMIRRSATRVELAGSTRADQAAEALHEIKTVAAAVRGAGDILRDEFPPEHPKAEFLAILTRELERLLGLIEGFVNGARKLETGAPRESVDLYALVREVLILCSGTALRNGIRLVPSRSGRTVVLGDGEELRRLICNLVVNALQVAPPDTQVRVLIREGCGKGRSAGTVRLEVQDEGPGLPLEDGSLLFEPFFTTKPGGTGLGLAVSRRIARSHGGELSARNRREGGAAVALDLPLEPAQIAPGAAPQTAPQQAG